MRAGKVAIGVLLAAAVCAAVVVCSLGLSQGAANTATRTLTVQSAPISRVVISGTHGGTCNYAVSDGDNAAVSLAAPESWMDGTTQYEFVRWTVNGSAQPAGQVTVAFSLSQDTTAVAEYEPLVAPNTITVEYPYAGEREERGTNMDIYWSWTGDPGPNVKIGLYKGGVWKRMLTTSTPNDGLFSWAIPCGVVPASDYQLKVTSLTYPSVYDYSDNIGISSFNMWVPDDGESWKRGTTHSINWITKCSPGPNVKLALYKGGVWVRMIASSTPNDGWYSWAIPASTAAGSDYRVRVTALSNGADWIGSWRDFSITE